MFIKIFKNGFFYHYIELKFMIYSNLFIFTLIFSNYMHNLWDVIKLFYIFYYLFYMILLYINTK